jgi:UDP-N-acetylglucosamine--N-acetylmuramyl-(pentapeptide) pyrophosphoryl-undecaprenol N-acetylglucosamine transferase
MKVVLATGGTGGHVFPALALAEELRSRDVSVVWTGRADGLEGRVSREHGFELAPISAGGFFGKSVVAKVRALWLLGAGVFRAMAMLRRVSPDAVVATGGFASAAVLSAAGLMGVPFFLLEQNCIPGRVTRTFARRARESFLAFPTEKPFPGPHSVTGNPLRPELARNGRNDDGRTVLVIGGSLGAQALNLTALDCAAALGNMSFIILSGQRDYQFIRARVRSHNCEVIEFTDHPEDLYRRATIAVSRAGGVVLSELVAFGIPAILVPFPYAVDRHQDANAQYLASVGAAAVLDQNRISGLIAAIRTLMEDDKRRREMEQAALAVARPDAAQRISERVKSCLAA